LGKKRIPKPKFNPVKELPRLNAEPNYEIKTRKPMWDDWRLNIVRGIRENQLTLEANKIARRKCWVTGEAFEKCTVDQGFAKEYRCKKEFNEFVNCCHWEQQVELDKMRRDLKRHTEWWWLNIYDEHGEIGKQAEWKPEENFVKMWFKNILYNYFFKPLYQITPVQKEARLEELRMKQGKDIDTVNDEFNYKYKYEGKKTFEG
jgi:hypothetical protein